MRADRGARHDGATVAGLVPTLLAVVAIVWARLPQDEIAHPLDVPAEPLDVPAPGLSPSSKTP